MNSIAFSGFVLPAFFQTGNPIYASKAVRIRLGHSKLPPGEESFVTDENENRKATADENYVWTYTSPEFPMLPVSWLKASIFTPLVHSSTGHQVAASFKMASGTVKYRCGTLRILAVCLEYAGEITPSAR